MKDQYFGDVNDFRKYGLLRALQSAGDARLLVVWMLTPDDGGSDGGLRTYLEQPDGWKDRDPHLYTQLAAMLRSVSTPRVSMIEATDLLPRASYHSEIAPDSRMARDTWREGLLAAASKTDLVFLDPDNGIEIPSKPVGHKNSSKYVTWREIQQVWESGCSLVIYQHFPRKKRHAFAASMTSELRRRTGASLVEAFRTARVLFLLAAQDRHQPAVRRSIAHALPPWEGQIEVMGFAEGRSPGG